ncbi:adenylyltransferase/cytidyltransferase family protein [Candidatus Micrarchaeota archaeon]|nr:adenylyltransferase/cytidyltransferase family protein [Candidatus Micrarchaeota archaeon]
MTVVATGGVFDILHIGHIHTLNEAKSFGDVLIVVIAGDEHINKKKRTVIHSQEYRKRMVEFLKPVDSAVLGGKDPLKTFEKINPDIIVYGYDQEPFLKPEGVKIIRLKEKVEPEIFKTSKIIKELGL